MVERLLFIRAGAGSGENNTRSRSKTDTAGESIINSPGRRLERPTAPGDCGQKVASHLKLRARPQLTATHTATAQLLYVTSPPPPSSANPSPPYRASAQRQPCPAPAFFPPPAPHTVLCRTYWSVHTPPRERRLPQNAATISPDPVRLQQPVRYQLPPLSTVDPGTRIRSRCTNILILLGWVAPVPPCRLLAVATRLL